MIPSKCEQDLLIPCYFFDINKNFRPAAFFDLAQEMAMQGSAQLGAPDWVLKERDLGWILSRMHVHFERVPRLYETVKLQTWHSGITGPLYTRDYQMRDSEGEIIASASSSWILMEISTRSITRVDRIFDLMSPEPQCAERALPANAPKVVWPHGAEPSFKAEHKVLYSDVDYNGHANNARYPVWAYDALPWEDITGKQISDIYINYNRELHPQDTVELYGVPSSGNGWIVEGKREELQNFICRFEFR